MQTEHLPSQVPRQPFTPREKEVLGLVAKARLRKSIASELDISIHTVDAHLQSIHKKTGTTTMAELILFVVAIQPFDIVTPN